MWYECALTLHGELNYQTVLMNSTQQSVSKLANHERLGQGKQYHNRLLSESHQNTEKKKQMVVCFLDLIFPVFEGPKKLFSDCKLTLS